MEYLIPHFVTDRGHIVTHKPNKTAYFSIGYTEDPSVDFTKKIRLMDKGMRS